MDFILLCVQFFPLLAIIFIFIDLKIAVSLFISYTILVPLDGFEFGNIHLGNNFIFLIMLFVFYYKYRILEFDIFKPFFVFYFALLFFILFQNRMPFLDQLTSFRQETMSVFILPIIIYNIYRIDNSILKYINISLLISGLICLIYGIICTILPYGINPYLMLLDSSTSFEYSIGYANDQFRSIGRVFCTFATPQAWSLFLGYFFFYVFFFVKNKYIKYFFILLIVYNILFCGVRTVIVAVAIPFFIYLLFNGFVKIKYLLVFSLIILSFIFVIQSNSDLNDYLLSIISPDKSSTGGSGLEMRMTQLEGCIEEINDNPLFGNGFRWTAWYNLNYGDHYKSVTFESLVFVIIACWGYLGFIVWGTFFYNIYKLIVKKAQQYKYILLTFMEYYLLFSLITGEYVFIIQFSLYYTLSFCYIITKQNNAA